MDHARLVLLQLKATCRNTVRKRWIQCRCQPLRILSSRLELGRCSAECPWVCPSSRTIRLRRRVRLCLKRPKSRQTSMRWKIGSVPSEGGAAENRPALLPHPLATGSRMEEREYRLGTRSILSGAVVHVGGHRLSSGHVRLTCDPQILGDAPDEGRRRRAGSRHGD